MARLCRRPTPATASGLGPNWRAHTERLARRQASSSSLQVQDSRIMARMISTGLLRPPTRVLFQAQPIIQEHGHTPLDVARNDATFRTAETGGRQLRARLTGAESFGPVAGAGGGLA